MSILNFRKMSFDTIAELSELCNSHVFFHFSSFLLSILSHTHTADFSIKTITPPQHMGKELPIGLHVCDYTGIQKHVITCRRVEVVNGLSVVLLTTNLTQVVLSQVPHLINSKAANITHCRRCVNVWGSCGSKVYTCVSKSVL